MITEVRGNCRLDSGLNYKRNGDFGTTNLTRLIGEVRAESSTLIDRTATDDPLGIFVESNKALRRHVAAFLGGTIDSVLALERGIIKGVGTFREKTAFLSEDDSPEVSKKKDSFISLTTFLSRILYYSNDPAERAELLYMSREGRKIPRYALRLGVFMYLPDIPAKHGLSVNPPTRYDFKNPATVTMSVTDIVRRQSLLFTLFPLGYSYFERHQELAGVAPSEGKDILHERARDLNQFVPIEEVVEAARQTYAAPGFKIFLIENGDVISGVQGDLCLPEGKGWRPGFTVYATDFPDRTVFQPLGYQNGRINSEPLVYMRPIVEGILHLKLKQ